MPPGNRGNPTFLLSHYVSDKGQWSEAEAGDKTRNEREMALYTYVALPSEAKRSADPQEKYNQVPTSVVHVGRRGGGFLEE